MRRIIVFAITIGPAAAAAVLTASPSHANPVHEVQVVAKQFAFEPAVIQVTEGEPVRLVMRSADRAHGFAIRDLTIDVQIPRSGDVVVEFTAPRAGRYEIACSAFCGGGHGQMKAALVSVAARSTAGRCLANGIHIMRRFFFAAAAAVARSAVVGSLERGRSLGRFVHA
jgi:heme/copper-type cytochrome/quinol oxidase subunit 2